jgi:hypothetical protein
MKEQRQEKRFCFGEEITETEATARKITVLGSSLGEDGFYSSETKHDRKTVPRPKLFH